MKKGKLAQHIFITLGKLNLQINADFLAYTGTYAKKRIDQTFFSGTFKFRNSHSFHEIDKKSNRKPKRLTMIPVTYAFLTILVSYK